MPVTSSGNGASVSGNSIFRAVTRLFFVLIPVILMACGMGCGREAPFFAPASLTVTSEPAGAAIYLDGVDSGEITPFTFNDLDSGTYEVTVSLDSYVSTPGSELVQLAPLAERQVSFSLSRTGLQVASDPVGASIFLDGTDTGLLTPAVLADVEAGDHVLRLELAGYHIFPSQLAITVTAGEVLDIPATAFLVRTDRTVLCEGFTNIFCNGCPQLTANLHDMQSDPDFGPDHVVILKYSMQWPLVTDPHYQYNTTENDARLFYYGFANISALPTLYVDGAMAGSAGNPPDMQGIKDAVTADLEPAPGFLIDVTADLGGLMVPVTVTLTALDEPVDLAGKTLRVSLVQSEVDYPEPPVEPNLGETVFYWVFRDQAPDITGLGVVNPASPMVFQTDLTRDDWDPATIEVIAYIQDDTDQSILQAGSTMVTPVAAAAFDEER